MVAWLKNKILAWIETTSSKINVWVWHKRWNKGNKKMTDWFDKLMIAIAVVTVIIFVIVVGI